MEGKNTETKRACLSSDQEETGNAEYNRRFEISNWLQVKECAICKVDIMKLCIECLTDWPETGIEDCGCWKMRARVSFPLPLQVVSKQ